MRPRGYSPGRADRNGSNGVRDLDVVPGEAEALGEVGRERLHPELLRRMVPRGKQVDPELAGGRGAGLLRLAGEERVVALVRRLDEVVAGGAGRDGEASDLARRPAGRAVRDRRPRRRARRGRRPTWARSCIRARRRRTGRPASPRCGPRAARCSQAWDARRARGGRRRARRPRGRAPRAGRAVGRRRRAARCARRGRGGRARAPRRAPPPARTARASTTRRTRWWSPRRRRRPGAPAARTRGTARSRAARSRTRRSRPAAPCAPSLRREGADDGRRERLPCPARGVAQPGSALRSGRRGPQFESGHPDLPQGRNPRERIPAAGSPAFGGARP